MRRILSCAARAPTEMSCSSEGINAGEGCADDERKDIASSDVGHHR